MEMDKKNQEQAPVEAPPQRRRSGHVRDKYAIIVGLSRYEHGGEHGLTNLKFADSDAKAFAKSLENKGWSNSRITLLVNERASKVDVENSIRYGPDLEDSLLVLYWSGHGYPDPLDKRKLFLACYDSDMNKPGSGLRMSDVRFWLKERKPHNVVIIADACHAGGLAGGRGLSMNRKFKPRDVPEGWLYLLGATIDEKAMEHPALRGGLFTTSLVEAIDGAADGYGIIGVKDGVVTMGEIREFVRDSIRDKAAQLHLTGSFDIEAQANSEDKTIWELDLEAD